MPQKCRLHAKIHDQHSGGGAYQVPEPPLLRPGSCAGPGCWFMADGT